MTAPRESPLGLRGVAAVQIFVRDLERSRRHYVDALDFVERAVGTPELEREHGVRACQVDAGQVRFVLTQPSGPRGEAFRWLQKHPDGVGRVVFDVADVDRAFAALVQRGATVTGAIERRTTGSGTTGGGAAAWFDVTTPVGDTLFRFVQREGRGNVDDRAPVLPGLRAVDAPKVAGNRFGFAEIDHITLNFLTLQPALMWMEHVMGLQPYWNIRFHTDDVKAQQRGHETGSGLRSVVMWDPASGVKLANNEPAAPHFQASQIYLFCEDHRGAGVQHVALSVKDIVATVGAMRAAGAKFVPSPGSYYDALPQHLVRLGIERIDEDLGALRDLGILVDGSAPCEYLLQVFMRDAAALFDDPQAGPLFLELIQRKGDRGFGAGNFRALFESIERQHEQDGRRAAG